MGRSRYTDEFKFEAIGPMCQNSCRLFKTHQALFFAYEDSSSFFFIGFKLTSEIISQFLVFPETQRNWFFCFAS